MTLLIGFYNLFSLIANCLITLIELTCKGWAWLFDCNIDTARTWVASIIVCLAGTFVFLLVLFLKLKFNLV